MKTKIYVILSIFFFVLSVYGEDQSLGIPEDIREGLKTIEVTNPYFFHDAFSKKAQVGIEKFVSARGEVLYKESSLGRFLTKEEVLEKVFIISFENEEYIFYGPEKMSDWILNIIIQSLIMGFLIYLIKIFFYCKKYKDRKSREADVCLGCIFIVLMIFFLLFNYLNNDIYLTAFAFISAISIVGIDAVYLFLKKKKENKKIKTKKLLHLPDVRSFLNSFTIPLRFSRWDFFYFL